MLMTRKLQVAKTIKTEVDWKFFTGVYTRCVIAFTMKLEECKCCCQYCSLLGDKWKDVKCIMMNEKFKILCLNKTVLKASATRDRRYKNNFKTALNLR